MDDEKTVNAGATPAPDAGTNPAPAPADNGGATTNPAPDAGAEGGNPTNDSNPKGGGTLAGDAGKSAGESPAAPVTYDFKDCVSKYSDEFDFTDKDQEKFVGLIKDMKLSNEQANAILTYGMDWGKSIIGQITDQIIGERKAWGDTAINELGAQKNEVMSLVGAAVSHIEKTVPGIRQALNETGAGNRIELIRTFAMVGKMLQSDPGKAAAVGGSGGAKNELDAMYPNTNWSKIV